MRIVKHYNKLICHCSFVFTPDKDDEQRGGQHVELRVNREVPRPPHALQHK